MEKGLEFHAVDERLGLVEAGTRTLFYYATVLAEPLRVDGWEVASAESLPDAQEALARDPFSVGVIRFGGRESSRELRELKCLLAVDRPIQWVALLPDAERATEELLELLAQRFYDYHTLPVDDARLRISLGHADGMSRLYRRILEEHRQPHPQEPVVGSDEEFQGLLRGLRKVASVDAPVLLCGESGTGKEMAARAIHQRSARSNGPFVAVNCGALPAALIQSELFGHEKGSFTGAHQRRIGRLEAADGGTIFLDEIGDLPPDLQVNLLRFLQEHTIERLGSAEPIRLDVRVIAATHVDLERAIRDGRFREDLYYRLNVLHLTLPPLRERGRDIELLARYYFKKFTEEQRGRAKGFSQEALQVMNGYAWPGNVRELMNRVQRAVIMSDGGLIGPADLGLDRRAVTSRQTSLSAARAAAEKSAIRTALRHARGNQSEAAKLLGVSRTSLYRLMQKHDLSA